MENRTIEIAITMLEISSLYCLLSFLLFACLNISTTGNIFIYKSTMVLGTKAMAVVVMGGHICTILCIVSKSQATCW